MYQVNDLVEHVSHGPCKITDILPADDKIKQDRYVLETIERKMRLVMPVTQESKLRPLTSKNDLLSAIDSIGSIEIDEFADPNRRVVDEHFREQLKTGKLVDRLRVAKTLRLVIARLEAEDRHVPARAKSLMEEAEKLVEDEASASLGIPRDEVHDFIENRIAGDN